MTSIDPTVMHGLEDAGFDAWPCLEEMRHRGWRLRFGGGYTKRANSVNATPWAEPLDDDDIALIATRYHERGLAPVYRLTGDVMRGAPGPADLLDARLARLGYRLREPSWVMHAPAIDTSALGRVGASEADIELLDRARWADAYDVITGSSPGEHGPHRRLLSQIGARAAFAVRRADGAPVACGLGIIAGSRLGLFEIATRAAHQGRGHAGRLCAGLLAWGARAGARAAFLQVGGGNDTAIRLYERLGLSRVYAYRYRLPPDAT